MGLILVCAAVMVGAAVGALIIQRIMARKDDETIELDEIDLRTSGSDGSPGTVARRLIRSIDASLDSTTPPNDTTAVLCMISTVAGRLTGPTLYIAPAGPDIVHRDRPWEQVELPGMQRITDVADEKPEQVAERLNGLVRGWVQNLYRDIGSVEPTESGDVTRQLRRLGGVVRDNYMTGMGLCDLIGGTRLVACVILVSPQRRVGEREINVVVETVLAAQWVNHQNKTLLWRQEPTQERIEIATVASLNPA
jgi:hypothetical protein